jgi:hypothetical protein
MDQHEQQRRFSHDIGVVIARYGTEFDIDLLCAIGILRLHLRMLEDQAIKQINSTDDTQPKG